MDNSVTEAVMEAILFCVVFFSRLLTVYSEVSTTKYRELAEGETIEVQVIESSTKRSKLGCNVRYQLHIQCLMKVKAIY